MEKLKNSIESKIFIAEYGSDFLLEFIDVWKIVRRFVWLLIVFWERLFIRLRPSLSFMVFSKISFLLWLKLSFSRRNLLWWMLILKQIDSFWSIIYDLSFEIARLFTHLMISFIFHLRFYSVSVLLHKIAIFSLILIFFTPQRSILIINWQIRTVGFFFWRWPRKRMVPLW